MPLIICESRCRAVALFTAAFLLSGCGATRGGKPVLAGPAQSVVLDEPAEGTFARPSSLEEGPDGSLFITDRTLGTAFRYTATGKFQNALGRKGTGPGEFSGPRGFAFPGDSEVVIFDPAARLAQRFTFTGTPVGSRLSLPFDFSMATARNGVVWIGGYDLGKNVSVIRWDVATDKQTTLVPLPDSYHKYPLLQLLGGAIVALGADRMLVGFGIGTVDIVDQVSGRILDTVNVPVKFRRGFPDSARAIAAAGKGFTVFDAMSSLELVHELSGGSTAFVYFDLIRKKSGFTSKIYLTVLDRALHPLCVDALVPQLDENVPILRFAGDTLLVLEQPVTGSDSVRTVVRRFVVPSSLKC